MILPKAIGIKLSYEVYYVLRFCLLLAPIANIFGVRRQILVDQRLCARVGEDEREAEVEIAQGVKVRVVKATITQVLTGAAQAANDQGRA